MSTGLENLLRCGACKLQYDVVANKPKLLVCHHCFCMQCVKTFIKTKSNQTVICPTCSKVTCIGRNGVAALPDNEYLLPQLEFQIAEDKSKVAVVPEPEIFVSDESDDEDFDNQEEVVSDEEGYDAARATSVSGAVQAQTVDGVPIFCETCLCLATPACLTSHQLCNYEHGVRQLQMRLEVAMQQAKHNLAREVTLLEENCKQMTMIMKSWTSVGLKADQQYNSMDFNLSTARSLLQKLPDSKMGMQSAKIGNPSTLSRAVNDTEALVVHSARRLKQARIKSNFLASMSYCKINITCQQSTSDPLVIELNSTEAMTEDMLCLWLALTKLVENRSDDMIPTCAMSSMSITPPVVVDHASTSPPPINQLGQNNTKLNDADKSSTGSVAVTSNKISKPMSSGCVYCFFDLGQGSTELGRIIMIINCKSAPKMSNNFIDLCTGKHGFGYLNSTVWKTSSGDHVGGGDILEGGQCSIYDKKPFLGDASTMQDSLGALRMRGRGTSNDGQPIVGAQFMIWVQEIEFKKYSRTLVFGHVTEGLDILSNMAEPRQRKGKPFMPPIVIIQCGVLE